MKYLLFNALLGASLFLPSCQQVENKIEVSHLQKPVESDLSPELIKKIAHIKPSDRQYNWQSMEFTAFIHYGMNTFTDREWGNGFEKPEWFKPQGLDTDQWCKFLSENGYKMVILTAKHHEGFCLWQSRYTNHSVKSSPWRDGKGDVLKDLAASCKKYGIEMGVYLSPADLFQIESKPAFGAGLYGNLSKARKRTIPEKVPGAKPFKDKRTFEVVADDYNAYFMNQLFEVLTEYGDIAEVWFDGAHPKRKGGQTYDKVAWEKLIRTLQPNIIIHGNQFDEMRWVGNEAGFAREKEWSVIPKKYSEKNPWKKKDIGSRKFIKSTGEEEFLFLPAETDVSIRPGWFYHQAQDDKVKDPDHLFKIYLESIGRNSTLLLNFPVDKKGVIHANEVKAHEEFYSRLKKALAKDFASGASIVSSHHKKGFEAHAILDDKPDTFWQTEGGQEQAELQLILKEESTFNMISLQEHLKVGQRIESFRIMAEINNKWQEVATGSTVGYKRILKLFEPITTSKLKVVIDQSRYAPTLDSIALHYYQDSVHPPTIDTQNGLISLAAPKELIFFSKRHKIKHEINSADYEVRYTTDSSEVTSNSPLYKKPIAAKTGVIKTKCFSQGRSSRQLTYKVSYPKEFISPIEQAKGSNSLILKLKENEAVTGFSFFPGKHRKHRCLISQYSLYASSNGTDWQAIKENDTFGNIKNDPSERERSFKARPARFLKFVWHKSENNNYNLPAEQVKIFVK